MTKLSCPSMPAQLIYLSSLGKLSLSESLMFRNPLGYSLDFEEDIHPSYEFLCSLLQMGLGYPTCVRRGPILVKYMIVCRI